MISTKKSFDGKCPNCGKGKLKLILGEYVCHECEFHSKTGRKRMGSFR